MRLGKLLRWLAPAVALLVVFTPGCRHWSCYGLQFNRLDFVPRGAIVVTAADEQAHASLEWVASQVSAGSRFGQIDGQARVDDFRAYARDHQLDLDGVQPPTFVVRGVPVAIRPVDNCLM